MNRTRREMLGLVCTAALAAWADRGRGGSGATPPQGMRKRPIPGTGEEIPVIGMGTWQTFDLGTAESGRAPLREVLRRFFGAGGRVIDSSPMYGRAEHVVGDLVAGLRDAPDPFLATKVWTSGREDGIRQMDESFDKLRARRIDLMQVHNLVDWRTHLRTLREWKDAGRVRYIGVTHYRLGAFDELERIIRDEPIDFVQLPYSIGVRRAERRLLPAAADRGVAVLVMRPFEGGSLFRRVRGRPLPDWAAGFDCESWAQFFLKFVLGHPAVTCPIPATSDPDHMADNVRAAYGRLPDEPTRERMVAELEG